MAIDTKKISNRMYLVALLGAIVAVLIAAKLVDIQWVKGKHYRKLASEKMIDTVAVPAKQGNIYSSDGSLLATSVPSYDIWFDAISDSTGQYFNPNVVSLSRSLEKYFNKPYGYYETRLKKARANKNRGLLIAKKLTYSQYQEIKKFPLFRLGTYKSGMIVKDTLVRKHPMGKIAERTIGYERYIHHKEFKEKQYRSVGIEGAFANYINGKSGIRIIQKVSRGQWKPISDDNQVEPIDGYDVVSTIDVYIQDIAHHSLLKQLEKYQASHGCVVVMETKTGYVRAISNLGRTENGTYAETVNYAIRDAYEPGSTFKTASLLALLDDNKIDTAQVYDTHAGKITFRGQDVTDSNHRGYGKISIARALEVSSNTAIVQAVYQNYKDNPQDFIDRLKAFGLTTPLTLPIKGEGKPYVPEPETKGWSALALPWMAYGYGVSMTPLQMLSFYNAIANDGEMIRPLFVQEIKAFDKTIVKYDKEVIKAKIASDDALKKIRAILGNVVKHKGSTGYSLYSKNFSMAGKTGTAQVDYHKGDAKLYYSSSFIGFFPAEQPKYTCVVVIQKPNVAEGYYGADVAGPVFKSIAQKIYTDAPATDRVTNIDKKIPQQEKSYASYLTKVNKATRQVPNVKGMSGMDAIALLENLGMKVKASGLGKVTEQSIDAGQPFYKHQYINLTLK